MTLTPKQIANVKLAIKRARKPGVCEYVAKNGKAPQCVIGQLAAIEGVSLKTLQKWDKPTASGFISLAAAETPGIEKVKGYPRELLHELQVAWDNGAKTGAVGEARKKLLRILDERAIGPTAP